MPITLEIHHIDVGPGDSTLILVKNNNIIQKSVLIDAGETINNANVVDNYLAGEGVNRLDVMIATHYDKDHFRGLRHLLSRNTNRYNTTRIYDRGEQGLRSRGHWLYRSLDYRRYIRAIGSRGNRTRITANVGVNLGRDWLINQEILWRNANGQVQRRPNNAPTK